MSSDFRSDFRHEISLHLRREGALIQNSSARPKIMVLFDIDGTLSTSGSFSPCLSRATCEVLGSKITEEDQARRVKSGIAFRNWIQVVAKQEGLAIMDIQKATEKILSRSVKYFSEKLKESPVKPLEGSIELLKELSTDERFVIGVVTNNIEDVAMLKLESSDLLRFFERDGLIRSSEDASEKNTIISQLIKESENRFCTKFDRKNIFYVGDQVSDISSGKLAGIRTIGVSTGRSTICELVDAGADIVLPKLTNAATIIDLVERNASAEKCTKVRT